MLKFKNKEGFTKLMEQIKLIIMFDVKSLVINPDNFAHGQQ